MKPARQRTWFVVAGILLLVALVGVRIAGGFGERDDEGETTSSNEQNIGVEMNVSDQAPDDTDDAADTGSGEDGVADEDGLDPDVVPTALLYELIDELRTEGFAPTMPAEMVVEYEDGYETIVMRGKFENTSATEVRFELRDGAWVLIEPSE